MLMKLASISGTQPSMTRLSLPAFHLLHALDNLLFFRVDQIGQAERIGTIRRKLPSGRIAAHRRS